MNYKRIITGFFAAAAALCSVGCADDGEVVDFETELNLSFVSYTANKSGGSQVLSIESNDKWSITDTNDLDWYSLSATEGEGDGEITISVDANTTVDSREAIFNIASGEVSIDFTLAQVAGDEVLSLSPASLLEVLKSGATETIKVESNSTWSAVAVFGADEQAWFELSGSYTDVVGNGELSVVIDQNDVAESRSAYILFTGSEGASVELQITQSDADPTLELSSTVENATVAATVTSFELNVESNTTWTIAEETEDWISPSVYTGTGDATVTVNLSANTLAEARSYTLTATYEGLETPVEYTITQAAAASTISIDPTAALSLTSAGGSQEYTVTCNDTWTVEIPEAATWLSYELTEGGFKLTVAENTDYTTTNAYTATVKVVCDSDTEEYAEISVAQSTPAAEELFSVAIEGSETLSVAFAADQTTAESFKIAVTSYVSSYDVKTVATDSGDDLSWLTGEPTTNTAATATEYTMTAASNGELTLRGATITFTAKDPNGGEDIVAVVSVTQKGSGVTQPTTTASLAVDLENTASSTSAEIDITTNDSWSVSIPAAAADWLQTTDVTASSFKFETKIANTTLTAKTATVTVACDNDEDMKLEFTVTQAAGDLYFTFDGDSTDAKSVAFDANGSSSDNVITISTNDTYTVEATDNSSNWLTWDTATAGKITFTVDANAGAALSSVVTLTSVTDSSKTLTVNVSQAASSIALTGDALTFDIFRYSAAPTITVTAEDATSWTATIGDYTMGNYTTDEDCWLTISGVEDGVATSGTKTITFAVSTCNIGGTSEGSFKTDRTATVTITSGSWSKDIVVTQSGILPTLSFTMKSNSDGIGLTGDAIYYADGNYKGSDDETFMFPASGGTYTLDFVTEAKWTITEWVSYASVALSGTSVAGSSNSSVAPTGSASVDLYVEPNYELAANTPDGGGKFYVRGGGKDTTTWEFISTIYYTTFIVYQEASAPILDVVAGQSAFYTDGGSSTFTINSNTDWTATSDSDWLTVSSSKSFSGGTSLSYVADQSVTFDVASYASGSERTATVTFTLAGDYTSTVKTVKVTQEATTYVAPAVLTAYVPYVDGSTVTEYNTIEVTADSAFAAGQSFTASDFALTYTNNYAGSVVNSASTTASGSIGITSVALDSSDATKMIITTSDAVYNTDALTLTYAGSVAVAAGGAIPATTTFPVSYSEFLNENFEDGTAASTWSLKDTNNNTLTDLDSDFSYDDGIGNEDGTVNKVLQFDTCGGSSTTAGKVMLFSKTFVPDNTLGRKYKFSCRYKVVTKTTTLTTFGSSNYVTYTADWASVPNGEWGSRWSTDNLWANFYSAATDVWITESQDFEVKINGDRTYADASAFDYNTALYKAYFTRDNTEGASIVVQYDDVYFGNAQPRP